MSINPLQGGASTSAPLQGYPGRKSTTGASPFDTLLRSLRNDGPKGAADAQQAEAELLRIEMLQSTLSLFDAPEASPSPGMHLLESLLGGRIGHRSTPVPPVAGATTPHRGGPEAVSPTAGSPESLPELDRIEETAAHFLGVPYRFGGEEATGIDCSSFVQQVFRENRVELPRTAREQIEVGTDVPAQELRKGDLVFFQTYASYPSHVGIYLGDGKMIHASSGKGEVTISDINSDYYRPRYLGAKRVV